MDQRHPTDIPDDRENPEHEAVPECEIELVCRQDGPDHWTAVLTHGTTRRRLQATSAAGLAGALGELLRTDPAYRNSDADPIMGL